MSLSVAVGVCVRVCVDGFNMDVLVRVHGCVSLHFPPFYFSCFFCCVVVFVEICVSVFSSIIA